MRTVYYSLMLKLSALLLVVSIVALGQTQNEQQSSKTGVRATYTDSHEGMTFGVDPWTTASRYKEKFTKKSPFAAGVVALQVSIRNDNDRGVKVDLQSIRLVVQLDEENRQELQPLTPDDVADTVLLKQNTKDPTARKVPLPIPVTKPKATRDSNWTNLRDACQNAAVPSGVVGAHSSVEGLVYFDLRGEMDLLQTARLYVPNLVSMDNKQPISYFDIDLSHSSSSTSN